MTGVTAMITGRHRSFSISAKVTHNRGCLSTDLLCGTRDDVARRGEVAQARARAMVYLDQVGIAVMPDEGAGDRQASRCELQEGR